MKSIFAIIVALGLTIAFTSPTLASGKGAELYNAAANKAVGCAIGAPGSKAEAKADSQFAFLISSTDTLCH